MIGARKEVVCVDFGLDRLTALEVSGRTVLRWVEEPLHPGEMRQGDPMDPVRLGACLRQALDRSGIQARRVRLAISDEAAVTTFLYLPRMPRRHLRRAMNYAAEREMPFPTGGAYLTWDVLQSQGSSIQVCVAGAWKDVVDRLIDVANHAGLRPEIIEPRSVAMARALNLERAAILEVGPSLAGLTLLLAAQAPYVDRIACSTDPADRSQSLNRLLQRAAVSHTDSNDAPVLVAGELERQHLSMPMQVSPVSIVLNGHSPIRPPALPAGTYLANLGLAMR